jgi:hypothetical protein
MWGRLKVGAVRLTDAHRCFLLPKENVKETLKVRTAINDADDT